MSKFDSQQKTGITIKVTDGLPQINSKMLDKKAHARFMKKIAKKQKKSKLYILNQKKRL